MVSDQIAKALVAARAGDEDARWDEVVLLHRFGGMPALQAAQRLCQSIDAIERALGADILGQLGHPRQTDQDRQLRAAALDTLLDRIVQEDDPRVLECLCVALGHIRDPRAIAPLISLRAHPEAEVRYGVVFGLTGHDSPEALDTLILLSGDDDSDVRDWATFGLARQTDADSPSLRSALAARLSDPDLDTRVEAIAGLAARGDQRAIGPLQELLADDSEVSDSSLLLEASENLGLGMP